MNSHQHPDDVARNKQSPERPCARTWQTVFDALRSGGWRLPGTIIAALTTAALGTVIEALLFRGMFDVGRHLPSAATRFGALAALLLFLMTLLALDWPAALGMYRLGRRVELLLRSRFLLNAMRIGMNGSRTRSLPDLAFRAHWLFSPRQLIETVGFSCYLLGNIVFTGVAIIWVYPNSLVLATAAVLGAGCLPAVFFPGMARLDLKYREHSAALGSMYWDVLQGAAVIQAQGAQGRMRSDYSDLLRCWARAGLRLQGAFARSESAQLAIACLCTIGLVYRQAAVQQSPAGLLLLIYWAMSIPVLGREFSAQVRSIPAMRSTLLRFQELMQPAEVVPSVALTSSGTRKRSPVGVDIDFAEVSVCVDGNEILNRVSLHAAPGEHIAIVGGSGGGKSTLLGCLLGQHQPTSGALRVDGLVLDPARLSSLRGETAWIDPQVHLFGTTLLDNLRYGNEAASAAEIVDALDAVDLRVTLDSVPGGLTAAIGERGAYLSNGESQRLRIGRAMARSAVRLAVLDEPARGLGREQRRRLIAAIRRRLSNATLLCATHNIGDTLEFDRVLVIDRGRIVEQGCPRLLSATANSRYSELLEEERAVSRDFRSWRQVQLHAGSIREGSVSGEIRFGSGAAKPA